MKKIKEMSKIERIGAREILRRNGFESSVGFNSDTPQGLPCWSFNIDNKAQISVFEDAISFDSDLFKKPKKNG